jgi:type II secretory pathway component PulM
MRTLFLAFYYVAAFVYCALWKWFVPFTLPALLAGILGFELVNSMPREKGIAAAVILMSLVAIAWWQWWQTEGLRERISKLENAVDN